MRDQYERFEIEREELLLKEIKQWVKGANKIIEELHLPLLPITDKDYYKADGLTPEEYVDKLSGDYLFGIGNSNLDFF